MSNEIPEISDVPVTKYVSRKGRIQMLGTPWKMALTALITFALTFSTTQFMNSKDDPAKAIAKLGAYYLSSGELIRQAKTLNQELFWLGPLDDSVFTAIINTEGVGTVFYWPKGTTKINPTVPRRVVRSYPNLTIYSEGSHPLNLPEDIRIVDYPTARMIYGVKNMDYQTFYFTAKAIIVEVHYAATHTEKELLANADKLDRVR